MDTHVLEVKSIYKKFKDFTLENISFELPKGYIMGYVGQNGAGKTTTLNIITHLLNGDSGEVKINGITYDENPISYKESIGFIGDESYFPQEFTLNNIKDTLIDFYPSFRKEEFMSMVKKWKLPENKKIKDFSRGMKVKLMFASILARDTKLLILDEATNGLDPVVRADVLTLLQEYIADGEKSVLFSTHIMSDLEEIADYIFFINDGKKELCDLKDNIIENYVIVKGGRDDLSKELKKNLIGLKENSVGFEGLMKSEKAEYLSKNLMIETSNIDQIVVYFIRSKK